MRCRQTPGGLRRFDGSLKNIYSSSLLQYFHFLLFFHSATFLEASIVTFYIHVFTLVASYFADYVQDQSKSHVLNFIIHNMILKKQNDSINHKNAEYRI